MRGNAMKINRNARVDGPDGEFGHVRHVIVDPDSREVTHIVVGNDLREWTVPINEVQSVDSRRVLLTRPTHEIINSAPQFDRDSYHAVDEDAAREESRRTALHGGEPLPDANGHAVVTGAGGRTPDEQHRDSAGTGPYELQLRSERLRVTTEQEQSGRVRLRKEIVEHIETVQVPVREERLVIEVLPGNGRVLIGDRELAAGESIDILLMSERVIVDKQAVVHEEVHVRKEMVMRTENVQETLRTEHLAVDDPDRLARHASATAVTDREGAAPAAGAGFISRPGKVVDYQPSGSRADGGIGN